MAKGHTIDIVEGTQRVTVTIDGTKVAESTRPLLLHETGIPVRYYLHPDDVDFTALRATDTRTVCPFKGEASYWTHAGPAGERVDVAWAYPDPIPEVRAIKDHLSFYDTVAEIAVAD